MKKFLLNELLKVVVVFPSNNHTDCGIFGDTPQTQGA